MRIASLSRVLMGLTALVCLFYGLSWFTEGKVRKEEEAYVNVYDWYGMLPRSILQQFEEESGIKVRYDMYDNNEILEAKLLASNSGYDVVFPSASPYVARQIAVGIYQPLNKSLLPQLKNLETTLISQMETIDPGLVYTVPYYWGTLGIAFDKDKLTSLLPGVSLDSYEILLNPDNLKRLEKFGVSFLEEAVDVFPLVLAYLNRDPHSVALEDLELAYQHLLKLRPYIRRFTSSKFLNDLVMGDVCVAQAWSGEAQQAEREAKELGRNIQYIIPKEGTTLWIDCIAIPVGAPHPKNAHIFINFLLRPDISAKITDHTSIPTTLRDAFPLVSDSIRQNPTIYPPPEVMKKLRLDHPQTDRQGLEYDRERTKAWAKIRLFH